MSPLAEAVLFCLNHIAKRGGDASVCSEARAHIAKLEAADGAKHYGIKFHPDAFHLSWPSVAVDESTGKAAEKL